MYPWQKYPFLKITIPFVGGILAADFFYYDTQSELTLFLIALNVLLLVLILVNRWIFALSKYFSVLAWAAAFALGVVAYLNNYDLNDPNHFSKNLHQGVAKIVILSTPKSGKYVKAEAKVIAIGSAEENLYDVNGHCMVFLEVDSSRHVFEGDELLIIGNFFKTHNNPNPNTFNYDKYLYYNKIRHQIFVKKENWQILGHNKRSWIWNHAANYRRKLYSILEKYVTTKTKLSIAAAMVLGKRETMDTETIDAFSDTGAIHVLAVSGLHVGIVAAILYFFFGLMRSDAWLPTNFQALIYITCVSAFAFITGAAPAVMRASLMFALIQIGKLLGRNMNSYNLLFAAAFCILFFDPYQLFDLGFQFSFLAVFGILYFMPRFQNIYTSKYTLLTKFYDLTAVSFAAQFLVVPLSILKFKKLALLFWLSGAAVVLLAFGIMYSSILLFFFEGIIPKLNSIIFSELLNALLDCMQKVVMQIQKLKYCVWEPLYLDHVSVFLLYTILLSIMLSISLSWRFVYASLTIFIVFNTYAIHKKKEQSLQQVLTVYDIYNGSLIDVYEGKSLAVLSSDSLATSTIEFASSGNRLAHAISSNLKDLDMHGPFLQIGNIVNLIVYKNENLFSDYAGPVHNLILGNNCKIDLEPVLQTYLIEQVIVDSSFNAYRIKEFEKLCKLYDIPCYHTKDKAFKIIA